MTYRVELPNGIRVVGEEIPSMRSVSIGIWIGTGSRYESQKDNGISHFIEHMLFKGTDKYSARELAGLFDGIGGQVNAFTSKEYTCYYAKVLDEHFSTALDALADMLFHSKLDADEMEKEKKVVIEEIRMYEDTPDELVMDILAEGVYQGHPLGYTILGTEANLKSLTRHDLLSYMDRRYGPKDIVVSLAGNVTEERAIDEIRRLFSHSFGSAGEEARLASPEFHKGAQFRRKDIEQVHICLAAPGLQAGDPRLYSLILLNNALGNSSSSRLFQAIREERGMAYSVFSFHSAYRDSGMFGIYAGTSMEHADEVLKLTREICQEVAVHGITADELCKGKEQVKGSMMLSLESTSSRMSRLGKNELLLGREVTLDETLRSINAVSLEDVRSVAKSLLDQPFAMAAVGPLDSLDTKDWL